MAGDGDEGDALDGGFAEVLVQAPGHVFDEAGLADAGGSLEEDGHLLLVGRHEQLDLVRDREVVGLFRDPEVLDRELLVVLLL
jgi:hypothetical protein